MAGSKEFLTVHAAAEYLGCHPSTLYRLLKRKTFPAFRIGSDWRIKARDLDEWIERQVAANSDETGARAQRGAKAKVA